MFEELMLTVNDSYVVNDTPNSWIVSPGLVTLAGTGVAPGLGLQVGHL